MRPPRRFRVQKVNFPLLHPMESALCTDMRRQVGILRSYHRCSTHSRLYPQQGYVCAIHQGTVLLILPGSPSRPRAYWIHKRGIQLTPPGRDRDPGT